MRIPNFQDRELNSFAVDLQRELDALKKGHLSSITGNASVLLVSPSKKVYSLTVDDAGVLSVTLVSS